MSVRPVFASTLPPTETLIYPAIIITEMQPGSLNSASEEFIELYNQSPDTIDLTHGGWQLQIASSTANDWSKAKTLNLSGLFYPGTYYLLASNFSVSGDAKTYLQDYANGQFSSGLTASAGHLRLVNKTSLASSQATEDSLEWSTITNSGSLVAPFISGDGLKLTSDITPGSSIKRLTDTDGVFLLNTGAALVTHFLVSSCPSPTSNDVPPSHPDILLDTAGPLPTTIDITNPSCAIPQDSGGTILPPSSSPPAILLPDDYSPPKAPGPSTQIPVVDNGLETPRLTELLPNPAAPQTDAEDEFIELYNPNAITFDLSGFILASGLSGSQRYVFPAGSQLPSRSFAAFYASQTGVSLSNSSGQVKLYDPTGKQLDQTTVYTNAKEGQAWALAQDQWQWTDVPSPNSANTIHMPLSRTLNTAAKAKNTPLTDRVKTVAARVNAKKATPAVTKPKKTSHIAKNSATVVAKASPPSSPFHMQIVALVSGGALLYGAYEYRHDLANRFYKLRSYRAARRALRRGDQGWGGD